MKKYYFYPDIDLAKTGIILKYKIQSAGYSIKDIQSHLMLSCPQPIYRWFSGKILPSVNHLYAISQLLGEHMEDLIVTKSSVVHMDNLSPCQKRLLVYWNVFRKTA